MTMLIENPKNKSVKGALRVVRCHNLCPADDDGAVLRPVGVPRRVLEGGGWRPLAVTSVPSRRAAVYSGSVIAVVALDGAEAVPQNVGSVGGTPLCASFGDGGSTLAVMATDGAYLAEYDAAADTWEMSRAGSGVWPAISVVPEACGDISATLPQRVLSQEYSSGMELAAADRKALCGDISRAYRDILDAAEASGAVVAPCLARCRVFDAGGNVLYSTPPVLLAADADDPFASAVAYDCADRKTLAARAVAVRGFRPRVVVGGSAASLWARRAERLVLEMTPPLAPFDPADADIRASFGRTVGEGYARVSICGTGGVGRTRPASSRRHIDAALADFDSVARVVAVVARPLDHGRWARTFDAGGIASGSVVAPSPAGLPGGFVAGMCAEAAGATLWGGVREVRAGACSPAVYAASLADKPWSGRVRVSFADGHRDVVWRGGGTTDAPTSLSPLLCYPSPGATKIQVDLDIDGTHRCYSASMEAVDGNISRTVDASFRPVAPAAGEDTGDDGAAAGDAVSGVAEAGRVVATRAGSLGACCSLSLPADVRAMAAAPASGGAWDYGRSRFYCVCGDGTRLVTVASGAASMAASLVSVATVVSSRALCAGDDAVYALCHGYIAALRGSRAEVLTTDIPLDGSALLWLPGRRSLAVFGTGADTSVYSSAHGWSRHTEDGVTAAAVLGTGVASLVATADGALVDYDSTGEPSEFTNVCWEARVPSDMVAGRTLRSVTWNIDAAELDGDLTVDRVYMAPRRLCISRTNFTGPVRTPLTVAAPARRINSLWLGINVGVSADARISAPVCRIMKGAGARR